MIAIHNSPRAPVAGQRGVDGGVYVCTYINVGCAVKPLVDLAGCAIGTNRVRTLYAHATSNSPLTKLGEKIEVLNPPFDLDEFTIATARVQRKT